MSGFRAPLTQVDRTRGRNPGAVHRFYLRTLVVDGVVHMCYIGTSTKQQRQNNQANHVGCGAGQLIIDNTIPTITLTQHEENNVSNTFQPITRPDLTDTYAGWTKVQLAEKLVVDMHTANSGGAASYRRSMTRAELIEQFELGEWYAATTARFNRELNVKMATNAKGHPVHHVCGVCNRWIGRLGQLWAWRPITEYYRGHNGGRCLTTAADWNHVDAFCVECASK